MSAFQICFAPFVNDIFDALTRLALNVFII